MLIWLALIPNGVWRKHSVHQCDQSSFEKKSPALRRDYIFVILIFRCERCGMGVEKFPGTFEGKAGDIFVIKAGQIHSIKTVGDSPLNQFDVDES